MGLTKCFNKIPDRHRDLDSILLVSVGEEMGSGGGRTALDLINSSY